MLYKCIKIHFLYLFINTNITLRLYLFSNFFWELGGQPGLEIKILLGCLPSAEWTGVHKHNQVNIKLKYIVIC